MSRLSWSYLFLSSAAVLLVTAAEASAQSCTEAPGCAELGYTKSVSDCTGKTVLYCPFDKTKAYCADETSCASLGFTDTISECPGEYTLCPSDSNKGKCILEASPGDLKYSLRTSDHNGWLLCNGRAYSSSQYPELYAAIRDSFGSKLPNYSGYFLKAASTSTASNFKTAEQAGLPNITGKLSGMLVYPGMMSTRSGAFSSTGVPGGGKNATGNMNNGWWSDQAVINFNAQKSNSIYGRSSTVTPQNYSANVFIYAGRNKGADETLAQCGIGMYLNADGTCSKTLIAAKNPLGVIAQDFGSQWIVIWGGSKSEKQGPAGETCANQGADSFASFAAEVDLNAIRGKFTPSSGHTHAVAAINQPYYWTYFTNGHPYYRIYCSSSCIGQNVVPGTNDSYYYYCRAFVNK
ncbi:MAG: tail fiber protein [Alphaproteobacteria bacterium]|nr:tail fiber protein [Alphaproteobacteria bacterium]